MEIAEARKIRERFVACTALRVIPSRRNAKLIIFAWLAERFEEGRRYTEAEVNRLLSEAHSDVATLRRGMYDEHFVDRADGLYWRTPLEQRLRIGTEEHRVIETERLLLRQWEPADREVWASMCADPHVVEFLGPPLERSVALAQTERLARRLAARGYGWWVAEVKQSGECAGVIVLQDVPFAASFTPAIEVGWHLAFDHWKKGYAIEGGRAALDFAFRVLDCKRVVAMTALSNLRSQRVMERIGMTRDPATDFDFDHPLVPAASPLRRHVLYRIARPGGGKAQQQQHDR